MKVVVDGYVWLPKDELTENQVANMMRMLVVYPRKTTDISTKADPDPVYMYVDRDRFLGVPRAWFLSKITKPCEEELKVSYGSPMRDLETRYSPTGKYAEQAVAINTFMNKMKNQAWGGFLLKAGCAFGKTATSLEFARRVGLKTLIIVHKEFFLKQWRKRIKYFMPDARVGIIQQNKCEFRDCDFSIAMVHSLANDIENNRYPKEMYDAFGMIISDECHRIGAGTWSPVIPRFTAAWRVGLTATPRRKDGAQEVFFNHISDITYSAKTQSQVPKIRTMTTSSRLKPIHRGSYHVSISDLNSAQILTQIGSDEIRNKEIADQLVMAVKSRRKVMVVSERIAQLKQISEMLINSLFTIDLPFDPIIDYYVGSWYTGEVWEKKTKTHKKGEPKLAKRSDAELDQAERANVIFSTKQMIEEGLDIEALDVIVLATPAGDPEQTVGRVRRWCDPEPSKCSHLCPWRAGKCQGKPDPIVLDIIDEEIPQSMSKWRRRKKFYESIGAEVP